MHRLLFPALLLLFSLALSAQSPRAEIGLEFGGLRQNVFGEYPVTAGGRLTVHAWSLFDGEAQVDRFPVGGGVALFPGTEVTIGTRVGRRFGPIGVYGKVAPGFIRFDSNLYTPTLGTRPTLAVGGVLEFYSRRHIAARFDIGDTVVWYGTDLTVPAIAAPGPATVAGTRHQAQWSLGLSVWF